MNPTTPLRTRALLGSALVMSLFAVVSAVFKPRPNVQLGQVATSTGSQVRIEARSSHPAVAPVGTEFFTEFTVTLPEGVRPAEHVSLAVVLDRSGSMSGTKLEDAKRAVNRLIDLVQDGDELAFIAFGSDVTSGSLEKINAATRERLHEQVNAVMAVGGTNVSSGLEAGRVALLSATGAKRMILVSDGQPTEGITDSNALVHFVGNVHEQEITVTALGVGSDYDGALLSQVSERGGGMLGHLQNVAVLEEVLGKELSAARTAVGRNVELALELDGARIIDSPGRTVSWKGSTPVLYLADLRPNTPTRVVVRLQTNGTQTSNVGVTGRVLWRPLGSAVQTSTVPLTMAVLDDVDAVNQGRDEPVFARGVSAVGHLRMLAAASAYERGDDRLGASLLDEAKSAFGMSADALAGGAEVEDVRSNMRGLGTSQRKSLNYALQKKTLQNFGRENEGY